MLFLFKALSYYFNDTSTAIKEKPMYFKKARLYSADHNKFSTDFTLYILTDMKQA
jgi:hypothetical protein